MPNPKSPNTTTPNSEQNNIHAGLATCWREQKIVQKIICINFFCFLRISQTLHGCKCTKKWNLVKIYNITPLSHPSYQFNSECQTRNHRIQPHPTLSRITWRAGYLLEKTKDSSKIICINSCVLGESQTLPINAQSHETGFYHR